VKAAGAVPRDTAVGFFLSANRRLDRKDKALVGGEFVPALGRGKSSARKAIVFVPRATKAGRYFLLACADVRRRVKEANEKNNCRASKGKVRVRNAPPPVKVRPHLSSTGAVSRLVRADAGGTLSTSGPDGSTYKLEIPANALVSDETVRMTPVASVSGLPFAGAVAGVDLKPEGLMLTKAARLTIAAANPPPAGRGVIVGWHAGGEGFHL
jgi:hypothetical protein